MWLCWVLPGNGQAQESSELHRFGDWEVLCGSLAAAELPRTASASNAATRGCRAVQRLTIKETGEAVFILSVLPGDKAGLVAIASIPLGGYLVPGIEVAVDGKKPYKLLIETCTSGGCHAGFLLTGQISKDMRAGKSASFRIWSSKSQSSDVKVSLNGLADALSYLERRP